MSVKKNILANYSGAAFAALTPLIALPWYLNLLGADGWGEISFLILIQTLMGLIEVSFGQLITKQVAETNGKNHLGVVIRSFEYFYWLFSAISAVTIFLLSDIINKYWLNLQNANIVWGASLLIASQLPSSLYRSVMIGLEKQVLLNAVNIASIITKHLGAILIISYIPTVYTFIAWHSLISIIETLTLANLSKLGIKKADLRYDYQAIKPLLLKSLQLSVGVVAGILTLQMDRIILSFKVPLSELGIYTIAVSVSQGALRLVTPIFNAVLPQIVRLKSDLQQLRKFNLKFAALITLIVTITFLLFYLWGEVILTIWLKDEKIVSRVYPLVTFLLIGTGMNAYYSIGYLNWIALDKTHKILIVNIFSLVVSIPAIMKLVPIYGLRGATFGWISINLIGLVLSLEWVSLRKPRKNL